MLTEGDAGFHLGQLSLARGRGTTLCRTVVPFNVDVGRMHVSPDGRKAVLECCTLVHPDFENSWRLANLESNEVCIVPGESPLSQTMTRLWSPCSCWLMPGRAGDMM